MPDYVPIQDLTIAGSISDNDMFPMSDGSGAYAVYGSTIKSYAASDAQAAAADAAASKTAAQTAAASAANAQTAAQTAAEAAADAVEEAEAAVASVEGLTSATDAKINANDQRDNYLTKFINYDYNTYYDLSPVPESGTSTEIGVKRALTRFILNGTTTSVRLVRASGGVSRGGSSAPSSYGSGVTLEAGHTYRASLTYMGGSYTLPLERARPATLSVYKLGETSSVGTYEYKGIGFERTFTADGSAYNLVIYIYSGVTMSNLDYMVTLEDITDISPAQERVNDLVVSAALSNEKIRYDEPRINYGYDNTSRLEGGESSGVHSVSVWRRGTTVSVQVPDTNTSNVAVKLNGWLSRSSSSEYIKSWNTDTVVLTPNKRYALKYINLKADEPIYGLTLSVYQVGESTTIGSYKRVKGVYSREFVAEDGVEYNFALYISKGYSLNAEICVLLTEVTTDDADSGLKSYFVDEMADTVAKVLSCQSEPNFTMLFSTDIHRYKSGVVQTFDTMVQNMNYLAKMLKCDALAVTGDLIEGDQNKASSKSFAYESLGSFIKIGLPYIFSLGNHDANRYTNSDTNIFSAAEAYSAFYSAGRMTGYNTANNSMDFYLDIPELGIRIVSIMSCSLSSSVTYGFSSSTAAWLESTLDSTKMNIVVTHVSPVKEHVWNNNDANKSSGVRTVIEDFVDAGGQVVLLTGHSHVDAMFVTPFEEITFASQKFDNPDPNDEGLRKISGTIDGIHVYEQSTGDYTEDCWTVCVYKPISNEFDMIRFGAGVDRYLHCAPVAPSTVTSKLTGELTWSSSNTDVATVSGGVISGVESGRCAVLATDVAGNAEVWVVVVP